MLTVSAIKAAKPTDKPQKLADGGGLFLLIQPSGSKLWRMKYRHPGTKKENQLSFGAFPTVSLQRPAKPARMLAAC